jgi:hypothetical protein
MPPTQHTFLTLGKRSFDSENNSKSKKSEIYYIVNDEIIPGEPAYCRLAVLLGSNSLLDINPCPENFLNRKNPATAISTINTIPIISACPQTATPAPVDGRGAGGRMSVLTWRITKVEVLRLSRRPVLAWIT